MEINLVNGLFFVKFCLWICLVMFVFEDGDRGFWKSFEKMEEGVGVEFYVEFYCCFYLW